MKNKNAIKGYVSLAYTCTEQSSGLEQSEGCISFLSYREKTCTYIAPNRVLPMVIILNDIGTMSGCDYKTLCGKPTSNLK